MADYTLHHGNKQAELDAEGYLELLRDRKSAFVPIRLDREQSELEVLTRGAASQPPPLNPPVDHTGLSSDESSDEEELRNMVHIQEVESEPSELRAIADQLESRGYIVNNMNSLRTDASRLGTRKPKVFLRPKTAELQQVSLTNGLSLDELDGKEEIRNASNSKGNAIVMAQCRRRQLSQN